MSSQQQHPGGNPAGSGGPKKTPKFNLSWIYSIIFMALVFMWIQGGDATEGITRNISYSEFKEYVSKGYAEKVVAYDDNKVELTIIPDSAVRIFGQSAVQAGQPVVLLLETGSIESLDRFLDGVWVLERERQYLFGEYVLFLVCLIHRKNWKMLSIMRNCLL